MSKRIVIALLALTLGTHLSGCTSGGQKDDSEVAQSNDKEFAQEGEGDFADDSQKTADAKAGDAPADKGADLALENPPPAAPADGSAPPPPPADAANPPPAAGAEDELSLDEPGALPDAVADKDKAGAPPAAPADQAAAAPAAPPPTDEPLFSSDSTPPATADAAAPPPAADVAPPPTEIAAADVPAPAPEKKSVTYAPLQKVKDAAFTVNGVNLNRVYIGRPKDTTKSVSQKIYGSNRSKDLVAWNKSLKRGVHTGDKIYYSSPANPSDTRMLTYYEDVGTPPQTYTSKEGDNIRTVSKTLLGFKDAWKEVYETNMNVESRGNIPGGLELKYWPDQGATPIPALAQNAAPPTGADAGGLPPQDLPPPPPPPDAAQQLPPPGQQAANGMPPGPGGMNNPGAAQAPPPPPPGPPPGNQPPGQNMAANDPLAPPPPDAGGTPAAAGATGAQAAPPPPPPPPAQDPLAPPPGPKAPGKAAGGKKVVADDASGYDADTMMVIGLGGILIIAAAFVWVVIRKNRAKRMDLGQTQV